MSRRSLAKATGVSPAGIYKRRRRAAVAVAAYLSSLESPRIPPLTDGPATSLEEALADLHADLVLRGEANASRMAAVADLRREMLNSDLPRHYPGSNKHARMRARLLLRRRLQPALGPALPVVIPHHVTHGSDAAALEEEIQTAEARYWARDATLHESFKRIRQQLLQLQGQMAPMTEALFWSVQTRLWREEEDIRTISAARRVEQLAGPSNLLAVQARSDAAIALEEHGYLQAAMVCVERAAANLRAADVDPISERMHVGGLITRAVAIATRNLLMSPHPGDVEAARRRLDRLFRLLDRYAAEPIGGWALIAYRRRVQLDLAHALRERAHEGYRRGVLLRPDTGRYVAQAASEAKLTPGRLWKLTWGMTLLALEFERNDPAAFESIGQQVVGLMDAEPWQFDNQLAKYYRLARRAEQRPDRAWRAITLLTPRTELALSSTFPGRPMKGSRPRGEY
jgi:hypothetical protein